MRRLPWVIVWAACFGSPGRAEPIDWRQISADAKWSAHIDFDAAKAANTAKQVYEDWLSHGPAQQGLRRIREVAGIDLIEDLRSLTFYGTRFLPESGVVLVRAKVDRQRLLRFLEKDSSHRVDSYRSHKLHRWRHDGPDGGQQTVTGCFYQPELVVIGRNRDEVEAALDVLDGRSSSLAAADGAPAKRAPAGTIFEARARGLDDLTGAEVPFLSPIVRKSNRLAIFVGEQQGEVFLQAELATKDAQVAGQLRDVIQGACALAELQQDADPNQKKILKALQVTAVDNALEVNWRMPGKELKQIVEDTWAKRQRSNQ